MASGEGTAFGKYFLLKKIAAGGMGEIYLSKLKGPVGFEKLLVIKRILAHHVENQEFVDMFFSEARVAAQLSHSNVVQIFEMGEIDDAYFIAMEYCHGKSLRDVIDRARERGEYVPPHLAIQCINGLCDGLSYAHNARDMSGEALSIIHRDINPHNMLISYAGEIKVIDFGIAKSEMSMNKTETGTIKGKFVYMSPEQSAAEKLDKRSDIFSVGICLYETLTAVNPFAKANVVLSLDAIQRKEPPPPSETNPRLAPFDPIVKKALAKNRDERYSDCSELRDDLKALLNSGELPTSKLKLPEYMRDLFAKQIEIEKRTILETDSANTSQLERMRYSRRTDHSGSGRAQQRRSTGGGSDRVAAHAAAVDYVDDDELHSRLPFLLLLAAIVAFTGVAAVAMIKLVQRQGTTTSPVVAMAPVTNTPEATPTPNAPEPAKAAAGVTRDGRDSRGRKRGAKSDRGRKGLTREPAATATPAANPTASPSTAAAPPPPPPPSPRATSKSKSSSKPKATSKPKPKSAPPAPPPPPPSPSFGNMQMSTSPPVRITRGGSNVGQTIKLKSSSGTLTFGAGKDPKRDPFKVTVRYRIQSGKITYNVDASPWAIVRGKGGIGLGKTPVSHKGDTSTVFELLNPKEGLRLRITLRYAPP